MIVSLLRTWPGRSARQANTSITFGSMLMEQSARIIRFSCGRISHSPIRKSASRNLLFVRMLSFRRAVWSGHSRSTSVQNADLLPNFRNLGVYALSRHLGVRQFDCCFGFTDLALFRLGPSQKRRRAELQPCPSHTFPGRVYVSVLKRLVTALNPNRCALSLPPIPGLDQRY